MLEKPAEFSQTEPDTTNALNKANIGTKVRTVVEFITKEIVGKVDQQFGKPHKAIVFSQFTSLLNITQAELERRAVPFVRLDGAMTREKRTLALQTFTAQRHVQIILCSLKAAGIGLNLAAADHVLLIDPWWNPAVEDQAIDRAHRLGQQRPVRAVRFVAANTIEERILDVHAQKRAIADGTLSRKSREELQKMRLEIVSSLFQPI